MKYLELFKNGFDESLAEKTNPENYPYIAYSPNEGFVFSIIPSADGEMYTTIVVTTEPLPACQYNQVDLGLFKQATDDNGNPLYEDGYERRPIFTDEPLLFADRNIGASDPTDQGAVFQWGDTKGYPVKVGRVTAEQLASLLNYIFSQSEEPLPEVTKDNVQEILARFGVEIGNDMIAAGFILGISDYSFSPETYKWINKESLNDIQYIKYNEEDNKQILDLSDDAAQINMGSEWRMPTFGEMYQLSNNPNMSYERVYDDNGRFKGMRVISSVTGQSLYLPSTVSTCLSYVEQLDPYTGVYWVRDLPQRYSTSPNINFDDMWAIGPGRDDDRFLGLSIRGVRN